MLVSMKISCISIAPNYHSRPREREREGEREREETISSDGKCKFKNKLIIIKGGDE
jgi:hypothetical protein